MTVLVAQRAATTLPRRVVDVACAIATKTDPGTKTAWICQSDIARDRNITRRVVCRAVQRLSMDGYGEFERSRDGGWFRWTPGRFESFVDETQCPRIHVM